MRPLSSQFAPDAFTTLDAFMKLAGPAAAQIQDGLVNVSVGDDLVAACAPIAAAVTVVAGFCDLDVSVAVLGQIRSVDRSGREREFCTVENEDGALVPVTVTDTECD